MTCTPNIKLLKYHLRRNFATYSRWRKFYAVARVLIAIMIPNTLTLEYWYRQEYIIERKEGILLHYRPVLATTLYGGHDLYNDIDMQSGFRDCLTSRSSCINLH